MSRKSESGTSTRERTPDAAETRRLFVAWILVLGVLFGGTATWIALTKAPNAEWVWGAIPALVAPFPGKYLIFGTVIGGAPLGPWQTALLAVVVDLATALTLAVGLGWLARFAWVERTLKKLHDAAQRVLDQYPRFRRMAFFGVVFFVFLPLPASGSIGGTFVSQFVGLTRTSGVLAVTLGGILVSTVFALLATLVGARGQDMMQSPWVLGASTVVFAAFLWWAWRRVRAQLQRG
jgi:uncharacterized membrane protein